MIASGAGAGGRRSAPAGLARRLASIVYESLIVLALLLVASLAFLLLSPNAAATAARPLFQAYLLTVIGLYFTWFWTHGGQTVAMRAWRLRLLRCDGGPLSWRDAWLRFILALPLLGLGGLGLLWALLDRDGRFLHDRLAGTMIVRSEE